MAELEVNQRQAGDVTILDMSGAVRMGEGSITSVMQSVVSLTQEKRSFLTLPDEIR